MLKSFPVNGSSLKPKNTKQFDGGEKLVLETELKKTIATEIAQVKQDLFKSKDESASELKLLGELLGWLRSQKSMSLLMLCRQIQKIEVKSGVAEIFSEDYKISELTSNERFKTELDVFFKQKGLGFKIHEKENTVSASDILNQMLGGKLVIK